MMTLDETLRVLEKRFGSKLLKVERRSEKRAYVDIYAKDIVEMSGALLKDLGCRFNIASCVENFDSFEILYHFSLDRAGFVITVRTILADKSDPHIDTITGVTKSAWWIERETHELFGIEFDGNEDLRPLLLPEDWPTGVYPMRKDFVVPKRDSRKA